MHNKFLATTLVACLGFLGGSNSFAAMNMHGFYMGAEVGAADLMDKESHSVNPESHQLGSLGPVGGIFVGYDYRLCDHVLLALEGFAELTDLNTRIQHSGNTYKMYQDNNLGIRLLPEYVFTPFTVGHLVFGYVNSRFHINDNGVYGTINTSYRQNGFQTGLGFTTAIEKNVSIRLDALYDFYGSNTNTGAGLTTPTQSYTNRFNEFAGEFAIIYKFD